MINYSRLARAIDWYDSKGFTYVEVPWTVTKAVSDITKPSYLLDYEIVGKNKVLVGSAEQSFLYQYLKGFLPKGKFMAVTPCFRDDVFDLTHTKHFMKLELIDTNDVSEANLDNIVEYAHSFFTLEMFDDVKITKTHEGFDITYKNIELGSYGIRKTSFLNWIYATGLAEPRFSIALEHSK